MQHLVNSVVAHLDVVVRKGKAEHVEIDFEDLVVEIGDHRFRNFRENVFDSVVVGLAEFSIVVASAHVHFVLKLKRHWLCRDCGTVVEDSPCDQEVKSSNLIGIVLFPSYPPSTKWSTSNQIPPRRSTST